MGHPRQPDLLDPRLAGPLDPVFLDNFYETLIDRKPNGELKPGLATEWKFAPDGKAIDLTLRAGVKFQDDTPFDAEAVKANVEAAKKPPSLLVGALKSIEAVEVSSPTQVRLVLSAPGGHLVNVLAGEAGMMISPKALGNADLKTKPVGTGPFKLTDIADGRLSMRAWDGYWNRSAVKIGGIEMTVYADEATRLRAVRSGQSDGSSITPAQVAEAKSAGLTVVQGANTTFNGILLNTGASEFGNPKVRQAMSYAVDRKAISDSLYAGACKPSVQPFQDGFWAYDAELAGTDAYHDVDKAKALLAEAGLPNGFKFEMNVGPNTSYQQLAQALQAQLAQIGITMSITVLEASQLINARRTGKFNATVSLVQAGRPDPSQFVADYYMPGGIYNPGKFTADGVADLLAQSRQTDDLATRQGPMRQIIKTVFDAGPPVIPVCGVQYVAAFRSGIDGFQVPVVGDYDFGSLTITK
ncbi:ABC transporter substrate-binding protein [Phytohabitans flavus]|uniref:ABC transporter substrate-binding protein n=1 Tax=Phytohabitans flavus TaxID=1076124 RepID=UPI00363A7B7B